MRYRLYPWNAPLFALAKLREILKEADTLVAVVAIYRVMEKTVLLRGAGAQLVVVDRDDAIALAVLLLLHVRQLLHHRAKAALGSIYKDAEVDGGQKRLDDVLKAFAARRVPYVYVDVGAFVQVKIDADGGAIARAGRLPQMVEELGFSDASWSEQDGVDFQFHF